MDNKFSRQQQPGWGESSHAKQTDLSQIAGREKELLFGLWYIEHLPSFKKILIGVLIAVSVITWGNFLVSFLYYLAFGMNQDNKMLADMVSSGSIGHQYFIDNPVIDLEMIPPIILANRDKTSDLVGEIVNGNRKYWAEFDWNFVAGSEIIASGKGFVLPDEKKYILALGQTASAYGSIELVLAHIQWHRIDQKKIKDWESFRQEHLYIEISDEKFISGRDLNLSDKIKIDQLKFRAVNMSPYNYREMKLAILLFRGGGITSAGEYTVEDFMSGQERDISMAWKGESGLYSEIRIIPEVNILDDKVYLNFN